MEETSGAFRGFPGEAFAFLSGLSRNNNKSWFDANRTIYDAAVVAPALAFIEELGGEIQAFAPSVKADPKVGGSLFRINRDTRFSVDKSPYKTHVGIRFRDGDTATSPKCAGPLFYVEFDAKKLRLGVGVKEFDNPTLEAYRHAVSDRKKSKVFDDAVGKALEKGHAIVGDMLSRVPPEFASQRSNDLLRRKGFFVTEETPVPTEIQGSEFVAYCKRWFEPYSPLFQRLRSIAVSALDP